MTDSFSFEALVREHQARVFRTLTRLLGSSEHVDDLAQQVFLRLFRSRHGFRGDALLTTYLYRITVNVAQDEWKRRRRENQTTASLSDEESAWEHRIAHHAPNPEEQLMERETHARLHLALQGLNGMERSVLILYHQEELSYQQIAEALRLPINTVRTHLHRGRTRLRHALAASKEVTR